MSKSRLTVEHAIVSGASQGMPVHGPDKNGFIFGGGNSTGFEDRYLPWNFSPTRFRVGLQFDREFFKLSPAYLGLRDSAEKGRENDQTKRASQGVGDWILHVWLQQIGNSIK
jgi:hypothetical protein